MAILATEFYAGQVARRGAAGFELSAPPLSVFTGVTGSTAIPAKARYIRVLTDNVVAAGFYGSLTINGGVKINLGPGFNDYLLPEELVQGGTATFVTANT